MSSPHKKFVIKNFKSAVTMDNVQAKKVWESLQSAIHEIYNKNASTLSFEELYRNAYNLVLLKRGDMLYDGVSDTIKQKAENSVKTILNSGMDNLLESLLSIWKEHKVTIMSVKDILMYMDRTYVHQHKKLTIYNLSLKIFREIIVYHPEIRKNMSEILLSNIKKEREGYIIDRNEMKGVLSMLLELGIDNVHVYDEEFERPFLKETQNFYRMESQQYLSQNTCPQYLIKAETRLKEEASRVVHYLSPLTESKLLRYVEIELITNHVRTLVDMDSSGCVCLMRDDKFDDLKRMYDLFKRDHSQNTLDILRECMFTYVKECGYAIIGNQENLNDPIAFVQQILDLRHKMENIAVNSFRNDKKTLKKLKDAFEDFMNKDIKCASHLASYIDDLLKTGLKGLTEEEADMKLDKAIVIFRYLNDKDVFENFYRNYFAKRLLNAKSYSDETEKATIAKLKAECGQQFTSKMEGMYLDMNLSKEIMESYKMDQLSITSPIEMEVQTLTTSHWSLKQSGNCNLPAVVMDCCERFNAFYLQKFKTGRRLTWITSSGSADMKANFPSGRKEINVSTYQMCILLLFNDNVSLSLEYIRQHCNISEEVELRRHLLSLCTSKIRILKKSSKGKGIEDDDIFTFNDEFSSKFKRIKVPLISTKEVSYEEISNIPHTVEEDRRHQVEAAIVRTMKARKKITHNDLVAEITRQLYNRFNPNPPFIKKRIESLIEREYLQRDPDDNKSYNYLA